MRIKLKPCPFCEGEAIMQQVDYWESDWRKTEFWVYCKECGASIAKHWPRESAIEAWNRRAENT